MEYSSHIRHGLGRILGFRKYFAMLKSLQNYEGSEVAKKRLKIIDFYTDFGEEATKRAYGADRKIISRWRKKLNEGGDRLQALVPKSTAPRHCRQSQIDSRIIEWIKKERELHPKAGKKKLKPDLDIYCQKKGLTTISESSIGLVIKKHNFFHQKQTGKIYHDPNSKVAQNQIKKEKRLRVKHSPKINSYGYIISDTVERIINGKHRFFISAIDVFGKYGLTLEYLKQNSQNMLDFYFHFRQLYPQPIIAWQSDNGGENLKFFHQQLKVDKIPHYFIYPHCPKIDAFIERYNRTLQEEFLDFQDPFDFLDIAQGNQLLTEWNLYYNATRRHHSLGNISPYQAALQNGQMSQMLLTYTPTE